MNDTHPRRRNPRPGRARKRAIREQAARTGVPYSVAARVIAELGLRPGESIASHGRTIYPCDPVRQRAVDERGRRSFAERLADTRRAAVLPEGRAQHLVGRFPPGRGRVGSGVGQLYQGAGRPELLTMLYLAVAVEFPGLVPEPADIAWVAEMGEETAVDIECALLDRQARSMLECDTTELSPRLAEALAAAAAGPDPHLRLAAERLTASPAPWNTRRPTAAPTDADPAHAGPAHADPAHAGPAHAGPAHAAPAHADPAHAGPAHAGPAHAGLEPQPSNGPHELPFVLSPPFDGVRQILDALLVVADDGHAPGTRVRVLAGPHTSKTATIVGAVWGALGPPIAYRIQLDGATGTLGMAAGELAVPPGQESLPG
ncbi:hypothetical protein AB0F72_16935 [Actinoplanes sp. NPDC023936]|uniref:hypothetical protein n=1 Tax=Actinoplanes sp. NPDC023936 TaxID=3154910 RepID=UPI003410A9E7